MSHLLPCCLFADVSAFSSCIHARKPNSGIPSRRQRVVYLLCYDCCALSSSWKLSFLFIFTAVKSSAGWWAVRVLARGCADSTASHRAVFVEVREGIDRQPVQFLLRTTAAEVDAGSCSPWTHVRMRMELADVPQVLGSGKSLILTCGAASTRVCPGTCVVGEVSFLCSCISL